MLLYNHVHQPQKKGIDMNIGISTASLYPLYAEQALCDIAKYGCPVAEIFFNTNSEFEQPFINKVLDIKKEYGINICSAHPYTCVSEPFMLFTRGYPRRLEDALENLRHQFDALNRLDIPLYVFHGDKKETATTNQYYFEIFYKIKTLGKMFGVTVAQENVSRCKANNMDFLQEMIDYLDDDVSLVFDNKQAFRVGVDEYTFIDKFHKNIKHIHISDHHSSCDCVGIGNGDLDLAKLYSTLESYGYDNNIIVELYGHLLDSTKDVYDSYDNICRSFKKGQ